LLDAYASVGAAYGLKIAGASSIFEIPHELWLALVECWNQKHMSADDKQLEKDSIHLENIPE